MDTYWNGYPGKPMNVSFSKHSKANDQSKQWSSNKIVSIRVYKANRLGTTIMTMPESNYNTRICSSIWPPRVMKAKVNAGLQIATVSAKPRLKRRSSLNRQQNPRGVELQGKFDPHDSIHKSAKGNQYSKRFQQTSTHTKGTWEKFIRSRMEAQPNTKSLGKCIDQKSKKIAQ